MDQTLACYAWTEALFERQVIMSLNDAQRIVDHAWMFHRGKSQPPLVRDTQKLYASGTRYVVELPRWARTTPLVLHEVAHSLGFDDRENVTDDGFINHGPMYMRTVIDLYAMFTHHSRDAMLTMAENFDLTVR